MYLNQFDKSEIARLDQILHTLNAVHGIKLSVDLSSPTVAKDLIEIKQSYEQLRSKIIQESSFNSYQQNPEYSKSILILEAVKIILKEIAPKRRRHKKVKESVDIDESLRLINTFDVPGFDNVNVYQDGRSNAYKIHFFKDGKHITRLDAVTDSEDEAQEVIDYYINKNNSTISVVPGMQNVHEITVNEGHQMTSKKERILENALHQPQEYEYQASMSRSELYRNSKYAMGMIKQIDPQSEVQPWIAGALTKSANYLDKVFHYLDYYKKFEPEKLPEGMDGDMELGETSGSIARENLMLIIEYSIKLFNMIQPGEKLEGWVAMKLTTASESISSCKHYLDYVQFEQHGLDSHFGDGRRATARKMAESRLMESETVEDIQRAQTIITIQDMGSEIQKIAEKSAQLGVEDLMPLVDTMRSQFGIDVANGFNEVVKASLDDLLNAATKTKETIDQARGTVQTGGIPGVTSDIENADTTGAPEAAGAPETDTPDADTVGAPDGSTAKEPPAPEEPLGRAKKEISETKKRKVNEKAPPGKKAEKFIKDNKDDFKQKYGKKWQSVLYATAWKQFGESTTAYLTAKTIVEGKKKMLENLQAQFILHTAQFADKVTNGSVKDPLSIGYGLEAEIVLQKIDSVQKELAEAISIVSHEMKQGIQKLVEQIKGSQKADALLDAKTKTPYGVIYSRSGKMSKKMFESIDTRSYWIDLNSDDISDIKFIEPETFDHAIDNALKGN